jgi:hypothetical protein
MLTWDKKVLPFATLSLQESILPVRCFDSCAVIPNSLSTSKSPPDFTNPMRQNLAQRVCAFLFTVLAQTQQHESLYAQSLA